MHHQPLINEVLREVVLPIADGIPGRVDLELLWQPDRREYIVALWTVFDDGQAVYATRPVDRHVTQSINSRLIVDHLYGLVLDLVQIMHFTLAHQRGGYC